jgi:signal transduction histidine kinase
MQGQNGVETNQTESIRSLSLSHDLYADLANAVPTGIYRTRVFHEKAMKEERWLETQNAPYVIEFANDRFFEILQLDRIEYETNPGILHALVFQDDKAEFAKLNVTANLQRTPFLWEGRLNVNDKVIWVIFKSIPRILENGDIVWTGTLDDITLRKQFEEVLKLKNAELQRLNADKDFFISILAHDLKSPFNSILGFLELLISNIHTIDINQIERQLNLVHDSANNAYHLLEDILVWALSQSGKLPFEPRTFNLKVCCDEVVEILNSTAQKKGITLKSLETGDVPIFADMNMLNTILRNLISNAIKFTHVGGTITLHSEQLNSELIISVSDNGVGISPDVLIHLIDDSQMHSLNGTANEKGTGFGLLLCKEFVEQHGGKIWAESVLGQGSVFRFTLPLKTEEFQS